MKYFVVPLCILIAQVAVAQTAQPSRRKFSDAIAEFTSAPEYQSVQSTIHAIDLDFASRDLLLEPVLELDAKRLNEHRMLTSFNTKTATSTVAAFLTKPFSTGTTLRVTPSFEKAFLPTLNPNQRDTFDWQISISQDLWQDFLGRSTRLRWSREGFERRQQVAAALQALAQLQVDFEGLYWDWAMALRERELRQKNVARGQEILKWMRERFARAAAESTDLLQAEALLGTRKLQLLTVEQSLPILTSRLQRYLPGANWEPDPNELATPRSIDTLLTSWKMEDLSRVERLELITARNNALAAEKRADEAREQIRPTLSLQAAYGKNGMDPNADKALREGLQETHEDSSLGVVFISGLDLGLEHKKVESARAVRDSAKQHLEALDSEARVAWGEFQRTVYNLGLRGQQAKDLAILQWKKADGERKRYRLGRTTAFQVISFEQDAAEAEIASWNLYALMRKTEAQARLFAR